MMQILHGVAVGVRSAVALGVVLLSLALADNAAAQANGWVVSANVNGWTATAPIDLGFGDVYAKQASTCPAIGATVGNDFSRITSGFYGSVGALTSAGNGAAAGQTWCFVGLTPTVSTWGVVTLSAATPTPVISNLRIVSDAAVSGGRKLCVDFTPNAPAISNWDWLENSALKATGAASDLTSSYVCWNRSANDPLFDSATYSVQIRFNSASGSQTSNSLSITVPATSAPSCTSLSASRAVYPSTDTFAIILFTVANATQTTVTVRDATGAVVGIFGVGMNSSPAAQTFGAAQFLSNFSYDTVYTASAVAFGGGGASATCPTTTTFLRRSPQNATGGALTIAGVGAPASARLLVGRTYQGTATFQNSGSSTWTAATSVSANTGHKVGLLVGGATTSSPGSSLLGQTRWLFSPSPVAPIGVATAAMLIVPTTTGSAAISLKMTEENTEWFGGATPTINLTVGPAPTVATAVSATDGTLPDRVRVSWTPGTGLSGQTVYRAASGTAWPTTGLGQTAVPSGWTAICSLTASDTSCDDMSAVAGINYDYRVLSTASAVTANAGLDNSVVSPADTGYVVLPLTTAPTPFTASNTYSDRIQLNWGSLLGATSYEVQRTLADSNRTLDGASVSVTPGTATGYADTAVLRGVPRCYRIRGVNGAGAPGPWSTEACGSRIGFTAPALTATQGTVTGVTRLSWGAASGYTPAQTQIYRLVAVSDLANWELLATLTAGETTWDDASQRGADVASDLYRLHQLDAAGNATTWSISSPTGFSTNIASGYANLAPTELALATPIVSYSNAPSTPVNLTVTDPNSTAGQTEAFSFSVAVFKGQTIGSCAIVGNNQLQWTPPPTLDYAGPAACGVIVTDRGGAQLVQSFSFTVQAFVPPVPSNVVATDGTLTDRVSVSWGASTGAASYEVFRDGASLGTTSASPFVDQSPTGVVVHSYAVRAVSIAGGKSALSVPDTGFANRVPTTASAAITTMDETASQPVTPSVVDPNSDDVFVFALASQPANGTAAIVQNALVYTPRAAFSGSDSFTFTATDRGGATVTGTASVTVACTSPGISTPSLSSVLIATEATQNLVYSAANCNSNLSATYSIKATDGSVVATYPAPSVGTGAGRTLSFALDPIVAAGSYSGELRVVSDQNTSLRTATLTVLPVTPPQFVTRTLSPFAGDFVDLEVRSAPGSNCPLTRDVALAQANPGKCLVSWGALPNWLQSDDAASNLHAFGVAEAGTVAPSVNLFKYDSKGNRYAVGAPSQTIIVSAAEAASFTLDSDRWNVLQYLTPVQVSVRQTAGSACRLVGSTTEAAALVTQGLAACTVEWLSPPAGLAVRTAGTPALVGRATSTDGGTVAARVTRIYPRGITRLVGEVSQGLSVSPPQVGYEFTPAPRASYVVAADSVQLALRASSKSRDACTPTSDEAAALASYVGSGSLLCYVDWVSLPTGLSATPASSAPGVRGIPLSAGGNRLLWRAVVRKAVGDTAEIAQGALELNVILPTEPTFTVSGGRRLSDGRYLAPLVLGSIARLELSANVPGQVDFTIIDDLGNTSQFKRVRAGSARMIEAGNFPLWTTRQITVRAAYSDYPSIYTEQTLSALTVPYDYVANIYLTAPQVVNDTDPLSVGVSVGHFTANGVGYDAATMGDYDVRIVRVNDDGSHTAITESKRLSQAGADGKLSFSGISAQGALIMKLVAVADIAGPEASFTRRLESSTRTVQVVKGTDISGTLTVSKPAGPAPLATIVALTMTRENQVALAGIEWLVSRDGGAFEVQPRESGAQLRLQLANAGRYEVKARLKNRNTGNTAETDAVAITAYLVPTVNVTGPTYVLLGVPATFAITATVPCAEPSGRCAVDPALIQWTIGGNSVAAPQTGTGNAASFTASARGAVQLTARARAATAAADDANAWTATRFAFVVAEDPKPTVAITGPKRVETDKPQTYTAVVGAPWREQVSNARVVGEWTLPDGSKQTGLTVTYTPATGETAGTLRYTAWVEGMKERTSVTASLDYSAWSYAFPSWSLRLTQATQFAPSPFALEVIADNQTLANAMRAAGAKFSFDWSAAPALSNARADGSILNAVARTEGAYVVNVTVSDTRGNTQSLNRTVTALPAHPYVLSLTASQSHPAGRVPLDVTARLNVTGGHPDDRIVGYAWTLDGAAVASANPGLAQIRITEPGEHVIGVAVTSRMGATASAERTVTAVANQVPTCTLNSTLNTTTRTVLVIAACRDIDGRIVRYAWRVNGTVLTSNADRISFAMPANANPYTVDVTATDDSGATVSVSKSIGN